MDYFENPHLDVQCILDTLHLFPQFFPIWAECVWTQLVCVVLGENASPYFSQCWVWNISLQSVWYSFNWTYFFEYAVGYLFTEYSGYAACFTITVTNPVKYSTYQKWEGIIKRVSLA